MNILSKALSRYGRHRCCPPLAFQRPSSSSPLLSFADRRDDEQQDIRAISSFTTNNLNNNYHPISSAYHYYDTYNSYSIISTSSIGRCRKYHTTSKKEILPFIAAGIVVVGGVVYTYRTFEQIDKDWDTYYEELEEYKARTGIDPEASSTDSSTTHENNTAASNTNNYTDISTFFTGGTMAIDVGTTRLKLSHRPSLSSQMNTQRKPPMPVVSVDREGFRSTPSLVWLPSSKEDKEDALVGRLAESRLYDTRGGRVVYPRDFLLQGGGNRSSDIEEAIQQSIRDVASNALDQALGASSGSIAKSSNPLFVLDASMSTSGSYNVRPIFTYPVQSTTTTVDTSKQQYVERYKQVVNGLTSPDGIAEYVPEPVAIVTGAEYYNLLPPKSASSGSSVLIVDVGGTEACVSLVGGENDEILYSSSLPLGGDTFIDLLVSYLVKDFYGTSEEATASESSTTSLSTKPNLNDPTALQRLYEASTTAIHELSNKTRSEINIPYLTMDLNTRQPKHLEVGMSRNVVYAEVEGWIRNELVPHLQDENNNSGSSLLSRSLPPPTNLTTLISSIIMSCLESTSHTPSMLRSILLVGGGGRIPLVRSAVQEGVGYLAGDAYVNGGGGGETKRLIIPKDGMGEELAVLGAAVWGSSKVD